MSQQDPSSERSGGYGSGTPVPPVAAEEHPRTILAFVLAIVGLMVFPPVGIAGLVIGRQIQGDMRAQPYRYRNEGLVTASVVLGWIAVAVTALFSLFVAVFVIFALAAVFAGGVWQNAMGMAA
jgi:hypothetical protein